MYLEDLTPIELSCLELTLTDLEVTLKACEMAFKFTFETDLKDIADWQKHIVRNIAETKEAVIYYKKKQTAENKFKSEINN